MRLYTFANFMLSSIQQGIQTAHVVHELFNKYNSPTSDSIFDKSEMLLTWSDLHKTIIVLNGGNNESLLELESFFLRNAHNFPWASFIEDEQSLNETMTCVGIVLPEIIYETAALYRKTKGSYFEGTLTGMYMLCCNSSNGAPEIVFNHKFTKFETELMEKLGVYDLAR